MAKENSLRELTAVEGGVGGLAAAINSFNEATQKLEREYRSLQQQARRLARRLEQKNRELEESLAERRRLEEHIAKQSELAAMGEVAAQLAHEIRNPLGAMELFVGLLIEDLKDQPRSRRLAKQVAEGIADLNYLVTNVLEHCGRPVPRVQLVALEPLVEQALRHVSDLSERSGAAVELVAPSRATLIEADRNLLWQVFLNLARNGLEAMPKGGVLRVEVSREAGKVKVRFADTGPGVPAEIARNIFQPFFTTKEKGTGLGLSVVKSIVAAHGGAVRLEPSAVGACFCVELPAREEKEVEESEER